MPHESTQNEVLSALIAGERVAERDFDLVFPRDARKLSRTQWTPLAAARRAAALLVDKPGIRVLDVGSGGGKFCLVGALTTGGHFTGVERDESLHEVAEGLAHRYRVPRLKFILGDALALDWSRYEALYLFNPFANEVENEAAFVAMVEVVTAKLAAMPPGARVVTYHGFGGQMPEGFVQEVAETVGPGVLQLWVRTRCGKSPCL